jgi:hypothetical protein
MKTAELTGAQLDYWVAKAESVPVYPDSLEGEMWHGNREYRPSRDWSVAGPIIERERIKIWPQHDGTWAAQTPQLQVQSKQDVPWWIGFGITPMIAAMRAFVASKFGDEVPDSEETGGTIVRPAVERDQ